MWSVYRADMNAQWRKNKVQADDNNDSRENKTETPLDLGMERSKKNNHSFHQVKKLFDDIGHQLESLIDNSFLGVPEQAPWSPVTDKRAAALSKPVQTTVDFLNEICTSMEGMMPNTSHFHSSNPFAAFVFASQNVLRNVREGLSNAILEEEKMAAVAGGDLDMTVESEAGEAFVDLGAKKANSAPKQVLEAKKAVTEFAKNKVLPFIDNLSVQISSRSGDAIVVTPDDCSVECSVASAVALDEFEDCPSVVTECEVEDAVEEVAVEIPSDNDVPQAIEATTEQTDDDNEYVLTEEPATDDEEEFEMV